MAWWVKLVSGNTVTRVFIAILLINHVVGLAGLNSANAAVFESLSWLNLLLSFILVAASFAFGQLRFWLFVLAAFSIGMLVEILGVSTGWPFGAYRYTPVLGAAVMGVPLIIGINWVLLALGCGAIAAYFIKNQWLLILAAAVLMVFVDILLEPFAIRHHLWVWQGAQPPLSNFAAWLAVSLIIQYLFVRLVTPARSVVPVFYILILLLFLCADKFFA